MVLLDIYTSPLGEMLLAAKDQALVGVWFRKQKYFLGKIKEYRYISYKEEVEVISKTKKWLDLYFKGQIENLPQLVLRPEGTDFQRRIWKSVLDVKYGSLATYKDIGIAVFEKKEGIPYRAIGAAVGRNPIAIIIPCHRIIGSDGSLCGYAGGLEKKSWLINHERG